MGRLVLFSISLPSGIGRRFRLPPITFILSYSYFRFNFAVLNSLHQNGAVPTSPLDVMERTLEHERKVTALINRMYQIAIEESDYAAQVMLHELIDEQVEEEKVAEEIVDHLRIIDGDGTGLLLLDSRLGERTAA